MFLLSVLVVLMFVTTVATSLYLYFQALCQVLASGGKKNQKLLHAVQKTESVCFIAKILKNHQIIFLI